MAKGRVYFWLPREDIATKPPPWKLMIMAGTSLTSCTFFFPVGLESVLLPSLARLPRKPFFGAFAFSCCSSYVELFFQLTGKSKDALMRTLTIVSGFQVALFDENDGSMSSVSA